MKKVFIILVGIFLSGCVAERKGEPVIEAVKVQKCPDAIKVAAQNLEQLGLDKEKLTIWRNASLSMKEQPCSMCQKLIEAAYILKDEGGVYKPAMSKLMQKVENTDPNVYSQTKEQKKKITVAPMDDEDARVNEFAGQYLNAVDTVKAFLISQLHTKPDEAGNFTLDHFFVPLMKNGK